MPLQDSAIKTLVESFSCVKLETCDVAVSWALKLQMEYWRKFLTTFRGGTSMEFSPSSLCDEELSSHVCQQTSRQQQNIFCCHDNQPGLFLCSTSKSYSWWQILSGTKDCFQFIFQTAAENPWAEIYTIHIMYRSTDQKPTKLNIREARTWKCFALVLTKLLTH